MKYILCLLVMLSHFAFSQQTSTFLDSTNVKSPPETIDIGYGVLWSNTAFSPVQLTNEKFNAGNIHDPLQLIQGRVSGLLIAKPGNDPNEPFKARLRGINSIFLSNSPLIIIDGMPFSSMLNIDVSDINKITVIKDAAIASQFGLSSGNGAIVIETHRGKNRGLTVGHYTALESPEGTEGVVMDGDAYVNAGGNDLGGSTDWEKEITRHALSNVTNISYGNKTGSTDYYGAFNFRKANGVLDNSGFTNYNGRASIMHSLLREKLLLSAQFSITHRENFYSMREAFKYAKVFNPTSAIRYGTGHYVEYYVFDTFNPEALVHQNLHDGLTDINRINATASYQITDQWRVKAGFYREAQENGVRKYWSKESAWQGMDGEGMRQQDTQTLTTNVGFVAADFLKSVHKTTFNINANLSLQNLNFYERSLRRWGFESDEEGKSDNFYAIGTGIGTSYDATKNHGINSARLTFASNTADKLFINANLSHEVFSDNIKGTAYGIAVALDLMNETHNLFSVFKPKLGYGKTRSAMSFYQNYNPANLIQNWRSVRTNEIKPENKSELTGGIDWAIQRVSGSMAMFSARTEDVIMESYIVEDDGTFTGTFVNQAVIENTGMEVDIHWSVVQKEKFQIHTSLNFSVIKNTFWNDTSAIFQPVEFVFGSGSTRFFTLENNRPVGQITGLDQLDIVDDHWIFLDKNGDGIIAQQDNIAFGKPLPTSFLGWATEIIAGRWSARLLLRGAFGHALFNSYRLGYENKFLLINYNGPASVSEPPLNTLDDTNLISDFYLEDASYLKLDNVGISYKLFTAEQHRVTCTLDFAVQNLFTITNYSGTTPEVRLDYNGVQYAAGFDSQFTYSPTRTFLLGVRLNFPKL